LSGLLWCFFLPPSVCRLFNGFWSFISVSHLIFCVLLVPFGSFPFWLSVLRLFAWFCYGSCRWSSLSDWSRGSSVIFSLQVLVTLELATSSGCGLVRDLAVLLVSFTVDSDFLLASVVKVPQYQCCFLI
jgi:hypothetical protein